jgi:hypothetical protein
VVVGVVGVVGVMVGVVGWDGALCEQCVWGPFAAQEFNASGWVGNCELESGFPFGNMTKCSNIALRRGAVQPQTPSVRPVRPAFARRRRLQR